MKPAVISEIKQELNTLSAKELLELCLQLAKYKKDNKELLSYLLFEADDLPSYIAGVKEVNYLSTLFILPKKAFARFYAA